MYLLMATQDQINCPKHGKHEYVFYSSIKGYRGQLCQMCWVETLSKCELVESPTLKVLEEKDDD